MGPIEPAAITAATLVATKALEALGGKAGEHAWSGFARLGALIRRQVTGNHAAEAALAAAERNPDDSDRIRDLAQLLASFAAQDPTFHRELATLIADARRNPTIGSLATQIYGQAQIGQLMHVGQVSNLHVYAPSLAPSPPTAVEARWPMPGRTVSNLPPRNLAFTGREHLLARLSRDLPTAGATVERQAQAVHGLGGVGKTHLVLEYAHRNLGNFDLIWWIIAEEPAAIPEQLTALARRLNIPEATEQAETITMLWDELRQHDRWLLVFDNAEEPRELPTYWPPGGGGQILATSRNPVWGGVADSLHVDVLPRTEAAAFLQRRIGLDEHLAGILAEALGDLPLALEQAAAYLEETRTPPTEYLELLQARAKELFERGRPTTSDQTVATTWTVSLDRLRVEASAAQDLLTLCAFLAPDDIPRQLFENHANVLPDRLAAAINDRLSFQQGLGALNRYSLAAVTEDAVSVHRLVQVVVRHHVNNEETQQWAGAAIRMLLEAFPNNPRHTSAWPAAAELLPHLLASTDHARRLDIEPEPTAKLLNSAANYLTSRAEHTQAKELGEQGLAVCERHLGPDHLQTATILGDLGLVLYDLGELAAARDTLQRALAIHEATLGPHHPDTATSLNRLGLVLYDLGELAAARDTLERALAIRETTLGSENTITVQTLNNLGLVLRAVGELPAAREMLQRALAIREAALGADHPATATSVYRLGLVLHDLGELPAARDMQERALAIYKDRLGLDHPHTARSLTSLAAILADFGDLPAARAAHQRALAVLEARLGPNHPDTVRTRRAIEALHGDIDHQGPTG